jgi:hypothetical protein
MLLSKVSEMVNKALKPLDIAVVRRQYFERFKEYDEKCEGRWFVKGQLPPGAAEYLRQDNPRLAEYKRRYNGHPATCNSVWQPKHLDQDLNFAYFRGDNAYIWQTRGVELDLAMAYAFSTYYVQTIDTLGLFAKLEEDGLFGAITYTVAQKKVSRDLLDSVMEINFLDRHLKLSRMAHVNVLDIGAGYGRLAYRLVTGLPNVQVLCADAIPESTFLCEYYLRYRGAPERARVLPLDEIETIVMTTPIDIATNIHSFSECTLESIEWWIDLISKAKIKYFMIVPNAKDKLLSMEPDKSKKDFSKVLERGGYNLMATEPVYATDTLASLYGLYPDRSYYLFRNTRVKD